MQSEYGAEKFGSMSSTSKGTQREYAVGRSLSKLSYTWCKVSRSGQVRGDDREHRILADLIAFAPQDGGTPHLLVSIGGVGKRLHVAFEELRSVAMPGGFVPILVRFVKRKRLYYISEDDRFDTLEDAFAALRER
jgi:hypothetical protein